MIPENKTRLEALDDTLKAFSQQTKEKLLRRLAALGVQKRAKLARKIKEDDNPLVRSVKAGLRKKGGEPEKVFFSFSRTGIWIEHGVGKNRKKGSPAAKAAARKWISHVLPEAVEDLADLVEQEYADAVVGELRFILPGVIDTTSRKIS